MKPSSRVIDFGDASEKSIAKFASKQPTSASSSSSKSNVPSKQPTSASSSSSKSNVPLAGDLQPAVKRPVADRKSSKKRKRDDDSLALVQSGGKGNVLSWCTSRFSCHISHLQIITDFSF